MEKVPKGVYLRKRGKSHPQILVKFTDGSWKSLTVETEELAEEVKRTLEREIDNGRWTEKSTRRAAEGFTIEVLMDQYLEYRDQMVNQGNLSPATYAADSLAFRRLIDYAGRKTLVKHVSRQTILDFIDYLLITKIERRDKEKKIESNRTYSPGAINSFLRHLKAAWKWAWREELIEKDPLARVQLLKTKPKGESLAWSAIPTLTQIQTIREHMEGKPAYYLDSMNFALWTGCRLSSITRVKRTDLYYMDVDEVKEPVIRLEEKGGKVRHVYLHPEVYKLVLTRIKVILDPEKQERVLESLNHRRKKNREMYLERAMQGYLFWEIVDKTVPSKAFKSICEECGFRKELTFHSLRKAHATYYLEQNMDIYDVSKSLGHSDIRITEQTYAAPSIKRRIRAFRGKQAI